MVMPMFIEVLHSFMSSEGDRGGERRRGAGAAVSRGMRRRPLLPLLLLALLRAHGLLAASGGTLAKEYTVFGKMRFDVTGKK
ncbi:unnamed protein product [Chrysodeixis includens]|uniref:Uncharacterized protein n=1 Tax=Chrysodeixis includens TaxID=689277 RepID=A0A9N8KZX4_CHRIL|nr:unnamed protein product [Chrysodeixis includens]